MRSINGGPINDFEVRDLRSLGSQPFGAARFLRAAIGSHRSLRSCRLLRLPHRGTPFHAARHGSFTERLSGGRGSTNDAIAFRHFRLRSAKSPSAASAGRNLYVGSFERRPARNRLWSRIGAVRDFLLRAKRRREAANICRETRTYFESVHG